MSGPCECCGNIYGPMLSGFCRLCNLAVAIDELRHGIGVAMRDARIHCETPLASPAGVVYGNALAACWKALRLTGEAADIAAEAHGMRAELFGVEP